MVQNRSDAASGRPRGRPRAYDPEVALRQAGDAFWRTGYAGTSLDDLVAATGMNRPSLFAAFGDKHMLYVKALRAYWERKFATMRDTLQGGTLKDALMRVYEASLSIYFSGRGKEGKGSALGCFVVGTALTEAAEDPEIRDIINEGFRRLDAHFEARFRAARAAGELDAGADLKALSMLASATLHTLAVRARSGASRAELKQLARKAVKTICAAA